MPPFWKRLFRSRPVQDSAGPGSPAPRPVSDGGLAALDDPLAFTYEPVTGGGPSPGPVAQTTPAERTKDA